MNVKKYILITGLLTLVLSAVSLSGNDFDLRTNMLKLNSELNEIQRGFISGDVQQIQVALDTFAVNAETLLAHKKEMMKKLPADMKNKNHKATVARDAARKMRYSVKVIREALPNKNSLTVKKSRAVAQDAYLNIVDACFKCHNVVRDKKRKAKK